MIYRAKTPQTVQTVGATVEVKKGSLVNFDHDPGDGWEEAVKDASSSSARKARRVVGANR